MLSAMVYVVNIPLLVILLVLLGKIYCTRKSPDAMRALAAWAWATADADDQHKKNRVAQLKRRRADIGVPERNQRHAPVLLTQDKEA